MSEVAAPYSLIGGYPAPETIQQAYDDADFYRAIHAYKTFFSTVSGAAILRGNEAVGILPNKTFGTMGTRPEHAELSLNSLTDTGDGSRSICISGRTRPWGRRASGSGPSLERAGSSYFRLCGPEVPAYDGVWKPSDFEPCA
jgi:hypothetical protein